MNSNSITNPPTFKEKVIKEGLTYQNSPVAIGDEIQVTERQRDSLRKKGFIAGAPETATAKPAGKNPAPEA